MKAFIIKTLFLFASLALGAQPGTTIRVGSKHFNEGYILSEMLAILLEDAGFTVQRNYNLGGTAVAFEALRSGAIDLYPEYTGTIGAELLKTDRRLTLNEINALVGQRYKLEVSRPYGFSNTYALVMTSAKAGSLGIESISDLVNHQDIVVGLSHEFLRRRDGWNVLSTFYGLPQQAIGLEHGIAYQALLEHNIDLTDAYSTDGEIHKYGLRLLMDDQGFFPEYQAVSFYRSSLPVEARAAIDRMSGSIRPEDMQSLNALVLDGKIGYREAAYQFLLEKKLIQGTEPRMGEGSQILEKAFVHLKLTMLALFAAVLVAFPLGIFLYKRPGFSRPVLYFAGLLQTIPSIALLALMIPLFGIGTIPALVALFLYALLPILRNTVIGLVSVDPRLKQAASAIGIDDKKRLRLIEVPMAMPSIITGIRTAAVINVGTATLAAFIGAGGLGEFIVTGLALNNTGLILQGAIPAAILAILIEILFEGVERLLIPRHLRRQGFR